MFYFWFMGAIKSPAIGMLLMAFKTSLFRLSESMSSSTQSRLCMILMNEHGSGMNLEHHFDVIAAGYYKVVFQFNVHLNLCFVCSNH